MMSDEWTVWHLTSAGWSRGSTKWDGVGEVFVDAPLTAIQVCRYVESRDLGGSLVKCWHETLRATKDLALLARTIQDHGFCPHRLD